MSGFLILHGIENHRPPQHWQFQLAAELVRQGHEVRYPELPHPDAPQLDEWLGALSNELAGLREGKVVVVCHSLACLLWFHAAASAPSAQADRVILVSPPESGRVPDAGASLRLERFDSESVRASARDELAIVCSDADPYNPVGAQALYGDPLGVEATILPSGGHITPDDGYGRWSLIEDWCLTPQPRP